MNDEQKTKKLMILETAREIGAEKWTAAEIDQLRRQRTRHQKALGMAGMTHGHVAGGVEHAEVHEDAARGREILQRGAIDRTAGCAHDSLPSTLVAFHV